MFKCNCANLTFKICSFTIANDSPTERMISWAGQVVDADSVSSALGVAFSSVLQALNRFPPLVSLAPCPLSNEMALIVDCTSHST